MDDEELEAAVAEAAAAAQYAHDVREHHARRTNRGHPQREADIAIALTGLKEAMAPLRSGMGKMQFESPSIARDKKQARLRKTSAALQRERRKLWKMQNRKET